MVSGFGLWVGRTGNGLPFRWPSLWLHRAERAEPVRGYSLPECAMAELRWTALINLDSLKYSGCDRLTARSSTDHASGCDLLNGPETVNDRFENRISSG